MARRIRIRTALLAAGTAVVAVAGVAMAFPAAAAEPPAAGKPARPTVVLVHGAFADASSWNGVITRLRQDGYPVRAAANPLRGLPTDVAAIQDVLRGVDGPIILVGHSYGGAVISSAAAGDPDVKALVYVAALVPDAGETLGELLAHPVAHPVPALPLAPVPTVAADGTQGVDLYIDQARFRGTFAADVDANTAAAMAVTQRPASQSSFGYAATAAAWRTVPSWYLVARQDRAIAPDLERYMAKRANAHTEEVDASHAVMVSRPGVVANVIELADRGTR
jgi:pimeloyl-ACP methyl ester carboxylesterase